MSVIDESGCTGYGVVKRQADSLGIPDIAPFGNFRCITCGKDLKGKVRIQNDLGGYVKCLSHGLGVTVKNCPYCGIKIPIDEEPEPPVDYCNHDYGAGI